MKLTLTYPPSANNWWRFDHRGRAYVTGEARAYKNKARLEAMTQLGWENRTPQHGDVVLTAHLYRPLRRGDLDNTLKVLLDSLNGIAYVDDSQVVQIHAFRHDDKARPRVEVEVTLVETF